MNWVCHRTSCGLSRSWVTNNPPPSSSKPSRPFWPVTDVLGGAQTGTGKTAGFTLPMLHRLLANHGRGGRRQVRALVLTPTRELAAQVGESIIKYAHHLPFLYP